VDWTVNSAAVILVVPSYARAEYAIDLVTKWQNISRSFLADGGIMRLCVRIIGDPVQKLTNAA